MRKLHLVVGLILFVIVQWISIQVFSPNNSSRDWSSPSTFFQKTDHDDDNNVVLIYNRIPKTASTTFMHLPYELCEENNFNVLLMNISHPHSMTWEDRIFFAKNVSHWKEKLPALYHGHFAYFGVENMGVHTSNTKFVYINIVRQPLERLISYYYFLRYGDDYRKNKIRSRMGDKHTFDECVANGLPDCEPKKLWQQVPWFCGHHKKCWSDPGNRWALEQAKSNLVNKYFLVGLTEELETFVDLMELSMPRFFKGAGVLFRSSENNKHIRKTIHKDPVSQQTINVLKETRVWKAEMEFYEFAKAHFMNLKEEWQNLGPNNRIYHYDKIRPRKND